MLNDKSSRFKISSDSIIGFVAAVIGAFSAVFSAIMNPTNGFCVAFISSLSLYLVLVFVLLYHLKEKNKYNSETEMLSLKIEDLERKIKENDKEIEKKIDELKNERESIARSLSRISLSIKNNSIHNNDLLVKVTVAGDDSYSNSDLITGSNELTDEEKKFRLISDATKYSDVLFNIFKRYCSDMLEEVIKLETAYLELKGLNMKVAASIKLFNKPYIHNVDKRTEIVVYTAFRDKTSYDDKDDGGMPKREVGKTAYSIDGNEDFTKCLSMDTYFINNVTRDDDKYLNEHTNFDDFYNCSIVVPVRTKIAEGNRKFYGFLCCDCQNDDKRLTDIFDKSSAQYLFTYAQNLATFLETLDSNWVDRFNDNIIKDMGKSAIDLIYKRTFIAEKFH